MSTEERADSNPEASERLSIGEAIAEALKASARGIDLFLRSVLRRALADQQKEALERFANRAGSTVRETRREERHQRAVTRVRETPRKADRISPSILFNITCLKEAFEIDTEFTHCFDHQLTPDKVSNSCRTKDSRLKMNRRRERRALHLHLLIKAKMGQCSREREP